MKYYAVIDTNVLISAMLKWESVPGMVLLEGLTGKITPLLNEGIVQEYQNVLSRPKFHFPPEAVKIFMDGFTKRGLKVASWFSHSLPGHFFCHWERLWTIT